MRMRMRSSFFCVQPTLWRQRKACMLLRLVFFFSFSFLFLLFYSCLLFYFKFFCCFVFGFFFFFCFSTSLHFNLTKESPHSRDLKFVITLLLLSQDPITHWQCVGVRTKLPSCRCATRPTSCQSRRCFFFRFVSFFSNEKNCGEPMPQARKSDKRKIS